MFVKREKKCEHKNRKKRNKVNENKNIFRMFDLRKIKNKKYNV